MLAACAAATYSETAGLPASMPRRYVVGKEVNAMCTFDSPLARCEAMHVMVLTDGTQRACAAEHACPAVLDCPLAAAFTGEEMVEGRHGPLPSLAPIAALC